MTQNNTNVYLGFIDEQITDDYVNQIDCTVNKIGGTPNWVNSEIKIPECTLCGRKRLFLLQIYAPLDNSDIHRTFYIFTCSNTLCSIQEKSWLCIRVQNGKMKMAQQQQICELNPVENNSFKKFDDDWGPSTTSKWNELEKEHFANEIEKGIGKLTLNHDKTNKDFMEKMEISAEIENEKIETIILDEIEKPEHNLREMLTSPVQINESNMEIQSYFIYVEESKDNFTTDNNDNLNCHVNQLMKKYLDENKEFLNNIEKQSNNIDSSINETYEKSIPAHGDLLFFHFMKTIQKYPGQIIRYSRELSPILIKSLSKPVPKCRYCNENCICEIQILPTLVSSLKFTNNVVVPIEYGNILIYTCSKSCWKKDDQFKFEIVVVQQESYFD